MIKTTNNESIIFKGRKCSTYYLEIINDEKRNLSIIFRTQGDLNTINTDEIENRINEFDFITLIFDYEILSIELDTEELKKLINNIIKIYNQKLNLIIKNTYINPDKKLTPISDKLILNKLEIDDELYSFSTNLNYLFPNLEVNELILKKYKFNSKEQLLNFCNFIIKVKCQILTLDDIFIELIIKKDENDNEYKDLDIYFSYVDGIITIDNNFTPITSLTLRDCPLFAIIGNIFTYNDTDDEDSIIYKNIDIDQNSLLNPSIITKFKIQDGKYDITFDLDSYKIQLEENDDKFDEYDYLDYLAYIFNIIISFTSKNQKITINEDDDGVGKIDRKRFHKLIFKNFDTTKLEYITDDDITFIDEKNWILDKEQKAKKKKWDNFVNELEQFQYENLSQIQELVFDNCSNFFIKWILNFTKGKQNNNNNYDLNLLKLKKCGNDYVNLEKILSMKINHLILFDTPLIIGETFPENGEYLDIIKDKLGTVENLTIKINSLEAYGKENNLNTIKTYEILIEILKNKNFNKNITFEFNALSNIMTFLAFKEYCLNQRFYYSKDSEDDKSDNIDLNSYEIFKNEDHVKNNKFYSEQTSLPVQIFFSSKKYRDHIYFKAFKIENFNNSKITLKNMTIKKETENYDNQMFLIKKFDLENKIKNATQSNELRKMDFGSDGFYIDKDYKFFFSENNIETVVLINVALSNYKDSILKSYEKETIINLISIYDNEKEIIKRNKYNELKIPKYKIDFKTLNQILYKNFLFEDIGIMFQYFLYKIEPPNDETKSEKGKEVSPDSIDKKATLSDFFKKFLDIIKCFEKIKEITIIIDNVKELKQFYCTMCLLFVLIKQEWIKESLIPISNKNKKYKINLPNKELIEQKIGDYFLKEENEEGQMVYSEMNYYYTSDGEKKMIKDKRYEIENYKFNIEYEQKDELETL